MADIKTMLSRLGMSEYTNRFLAEGFDTWKVIMDISEADLTFLSVSLTDRKRLQHEIAKARTHKCMHCSSLPERKTLCKDDAPFQKRRYRHHPRADIHGPKRPLSAYARFANDVRKNLGNKQFSFIQISRHVGKSWQMLGNEKTNEWKMLAAIARRIYLKDLEKYKQTVEYNEYQRYLIDFELKSSGTHLRPSQRPSQPYKSQHLSNTPDDGSLRGWLTSNNFSASPNLPPPLIPSQMDIKLGDRSFETATLQEITYAPEHIYKLPLDAYPLGLSTPQHLPESILEFESEPKSTLSRPTGPITPTRSLILHAQRCRRSSPDSATQLLRPCQPQYTLPSGYPPRRGYFETVLQSQCDDKTP